MFAAGSRYERREESGIAHFAEHMFFKGTERRPTARDIATEIDGIGGEFNAFTGKEVTAYYVKCAAETRDVALDVLVDMLRSSRFDADEIEREKGVIVEEMNMYADTPRSYVGNVWEQPRVRRPAARLGHHRERRRRCARATRETFLDYLDRWYRPERTVVGLGGNIGDDLVERLEELLGDLAAEPTGDARARRPPRPDGSPVRIHTKQSDQAHIVIGAPRVPDRASRPLRAAAPLDRARRRHVVTALHGGAGASRARVLRLLAATARTRTRARSPRRRASTSTGSTTPSTTIVAELRTIVDASPFPADELEKARSFAKGRFVLGLESPHATIMFGLRREVLEGSATEPAEVLAGLDAVTVEDVQRVAARPARRRSADGADRPVRRPGALRAAAERLTADDRRGRASPQDRRAGDGVPGHPREPPDPSRTPTTPRCSRALEQPLPAQGADPLEVIEELAVAVEPGLTAMGSGRYFGFVIGGALPASLAADWLVSAWDQNAGLAEPTPAISALETIAGRWVLELLGLPAHASFAFVTGCQMAHVTALAAARQGVYDRVGYDLAAAGLAGAPPVRVVVGAQRHVTLTRALRLLGIGSAQERVIPVDDHGRMRAELLAAELDPGVPTIVCAQAGEVNTGSFDDLAAIVEVAHGHGAWVHVDGAFGLWAAASPRLRHLVEGHARADSWATDAHKWLNVPYDCGIAICAHPSAHTAAMEYAAPYLEVSDLRGRARPDGLQPRVLPPRTSAADLGCDPLARAGGHRLARRARLRAGARSSRAGSPSSPAARSSTRSSSTRCCSGSTTTCAPRRS